MPASINLDLRRRGSDGDCLPASENHFWKKNTKTKEYVNFVLETLNYF
jgi:hypothetical protein